MSGQVLVAVDVGTHTVLAAAGRMRDGRLEILEDRQWFARLGEGVRRSGLLRPEAIERAVAALREARTMAAGLPADIAAVGTRACREARNAGEFLRAAREALGTELEVIAGEREAELTFRGASSGLGIAGVATFVDVGGGSTEVIDAEGTILRQAVSLPIGAVALTEGFFRSDPYAASEIAEARSWIRSQLDALPFALHPDIVGIGGTATTFAAMELGLERYDGLRVHGLDVGREALERRIASLGSMRAADRRRVRGLAVERADVVTAGGLALAGIVERAGAERLIVSDRGVRHGLLLDRLAASL